MKKVVLISTSLSATSKSALLIQSAAEQLKTAEVIDLRHLSIPFCDGRKIEDYSKEIQLLFKTIKEADALVFGFPIYCYSISGVLKNFIDIESAQTNENINSDRKDHQKMRNKSKQSPLINSWTCFYYIWLRIDNMKVLSLIFLNYSAYFLLKKPEWNW